jgi:hypothetical protein
VGVAPAVAPYPNDCSRCHKTQYGVSWATGDFDHKMANTISAGVITAGATVTSCTPCHTQIGTALAPKDRPFGVVGTLLPNIKGILGPSGVLNQTYQYDHANGLANVSTTVYADCMNCHKAPTTATKSWAGGNYSHSPTPKSCTTCHKVRPANSLWLPKATPIDRIYKHLVDYNGETTDCSKCHGATILNVGNTWAGAIYDHTSTGTTAVATCLACHSASVDRVNGVNGTVRGFVHSATYVSDCKGCHTPKSTNTTATLVGGVITANAGWRTGTWKTGPNGNHKTTANVLVTSCNACHGTLKTMGNHENSAKTDDCSRCHGTGKRGTTGVNWN